MSKLAIVLCLMAPGLYGEIHTMTLKQAVELALKQNPDLLLARLDERKVQEAVRIARDPFVPRITVGSGLAYSSGFPMSIEGSAPSIVQATATGYLFNRQQSYVVAQAKENARGATIGTAAKRDDVAFRTAELFLDAERAGRLAGLAEKQLESLEKVAQSVESRVEGGYELPIEAKRAALTVARARQAVESVQSDQIAAETNLAVALGFSADDRVQPANEERPAPPLPPSANAAVEEAMHSSKALRQLESQVAAKGLEARGEKAARLPRVDLVAQYAMFSKYNHYEDYFRTFQRNNGQLGISLALPLLPGPGVSASVAQTEADIAHLRIEMNQARNRVTLDTRQAFREIQKATLGADVARQDLDVARDTLSLQLAWLQEGRVTLGQVEQARATESDKWIAFYDAQYALERARLALLRQTGDLLAALR